MSRRRFKLALVEQTTKPGKEISLVLNANVYPNPPVHFEVDENDTTPILIGVVVKKQKKILTIPGKRNRVDAVQYKTQVPSVISIEEGTSVRKIVQGGSPSEKFTLEIFAEPSRKLANSQGAIPTETKSQNQIQIPAGPLPRPPGASPTQTPDRPTSPNIAPKRPLQNSQGDRSPRNSPAPARPPPSYAVSEADTSNTQKGSLYVNPQAYPNYYQNYANYSPAPNYSQYSLPAAPNYGATGLYNGAQPSTLYSGTPQQSTLYQPASTPVNYTGQQPPAQPSPQISPAPSHNNSPASQEEPKADTRKTVGESANREGYSICYDEIKFIKKIGVGGCGEVWKAEWTGTPVAVKKILSPDISEDDLLEFSTEILLMSKLRHPNIVPFLGACVDPEFCLITEFMHRGSLFDVLGKHKDLPWSRKVSFCWDIAKGILYLHTRKPVIVHRDIKSLNILVTKEWKCTIADFGFTKIKDKAMLSTRCGSPAWSAPEVCRGDPYNEAADVYSYGIVLWEIIAGEPPYRGMNPMQLIGLVAYKNYRPRTDLPCPYPELIRLMTDCWQENATSRPNFSQILERLRPLYDSFDD